MRNNEPIFIRHNCYYRGDKRLTNFIVVKVLDIPVKQYYIQGVGATVKAGFIGELPSKLNAFADEILIRGKYFLEPGFKQKDLNDILQLINS